MASQTSIFHVINYDNCDGCQKKVRRAVGVDLVKIDPENGHVIVSTTKNPEEVKLALERKTKKKVVLLPNNLENSLVVNDQRAIIASSPKTTIPSVGVRENRDEKINAHIIHGSSCDDHSFSNKKAKMDSTLTISTTTSSAPLLNLVVGDNSDKIIISIDPRKTIQITITSEQVANTQTGPHETINARTTRLKSDHRHEIVLKSVRSSYKCSGCKELGFGDRYVCEQCRYMLHPICMYYEETATHEFLDGSIFKFHQKPFDNKTRCCNACGMNIKGFFYHSETTNKALHPSCLHLPETIPIGDETFQLCRVLPALECWYCNLKKNQKKKKDYRDKYWCYSSENQDCHFHVYCMKERLSKFLNGDGGGGGGTGAMVAANRKKKAFKVLKWAGKFLEVVLAVLTGNLVAPLAIGVEFLLR